jgi:tripartite ATP-independent transporter DctP family solute receptor
MKRFRSLWLLLSFGLVLLTWGEAAAESLARELRAADVQPPEHPTVQALTYFHELVEDRTGGRYRIRVFHSRQLGEERETLEQTRGGAIDVNRVNIGPLTDLVPEAGVLALPFLFRSVEHLHRVLDGPVGEEILASFEPHGVVGLTFYDSGARSLYNSLQPIMSPADLKGLRIRVQQSEQMVALMRLLGAEPVALPYGNVRTALETGLVHGAENNWPSYVTTEHHRAARHMTLTEHVMSPEVLVVSAKLWATLSPDDREIFRRSARDSSLLMRERWRAWEERSRREALEAGVIVQSRFDRDAFVSAVRPLYEDVVRNPRLRGLMERIERTWTPG